MAVVGPPPCTQQPAGRPDLSQPPAHDGEMISQQRAGLAAVRRPQPALQQTDGKEITVVGSYGSETFLLSPKSALLATSSLSTTPTAANPPASPSSTVLP